VELSVVIPAKNEEDNVIPLIAEIHSALDGVADYEIVYVDDGSSDNTYANFMSLIEDGQHTLRVVRLKNSVGQSTAIMEGIYAARGALIATMDADGQNDPADIPRLLDAARQLPLISDFCITGFRINRRDTRWKRFQSRIANGVRQKLLNDGTPDTGCGLKIVPRDTFLKLPYFDHIHRFIPALVRRINGTVVVLEVNHRERQAGVSKYNMLGRLGVGIVDLLGVIWLQHRVKISERIDE
jgi:dolichol-phosphate mannosyltransferase